jgi:hypothetical protein
LDKTDNQGKFHLLAIFLIPGLLVIIFMMPWWVSLLYATIAVGVIWQVFKKKK